jgi:hypothetical protein
MPGLAATCCHAAFAGVTAHLGYFIHGERQQEAPAIMLSIIIPIVIFWMQFLYLQQGFATSTFSSNFVDLRCCSLDEDGDLLIVLPPSTSIFRPYWSESIEILSFVPFASKV